MRVLSFGRETIDQEWWNRRIAVAHDVRRTLGLTDNPDTNCYRLVHGEGDALPGLVVDIYGTAAVVQCHSVGMYHARIGDRQGDTGDLRRQNHGHLRQKFADGAVQRPAGRRGRLSVGQLRPRIAHRDGKRREIPRKLGERPEDGLFPRPARKPRTGETLRQRPHGAQHLLLHGRILGLRHGGRRPKGLLGGLLRTRRDTRHRKHGAQLRPGGRLLRRLRPTPWSISRTSATNTT